MTPYTQEDFGKHPLMFYYEVTQACDLVCRHCRASAQCGPRPDELTPNQSRDLIRQIASFGRRPVLVITGGDPLKRADVFDLIELARREGLEVALTPSATPLATPEALSKAQESGVSCLGISLDGADAETHDAFRGWTGSYDKTWELLRIAREIDLPVQINTSITARNLHQIDQMADRLSQTGIVMWSVFFLVPVGRGINERRISAEEYEDAFERLWEHSVSKPFAIKTTEAPHYRRWVLQRRGSPLFPSNSNPASGAQHVRVERTRHRAPLGVRDGNGIMFVGYNGQIYPAGFLPYSCGRFPMDSVVATYQEHPVFVALRSPDQFGGKCGVCEYRQVCGGSRSRAYAVSGDMLGPEPEGVYQPKASRPV